MSNESSAPPNATSCVIHAASTMRFAVRCRAMKLIGLRVVLALPPLFIAIHSQPINSAPASLQS
jgi:hypothetical protein